MRKYTSFVFFLFGYSLITFYIGWNGWVWLQSFSSVDSAGLYAFIVAALAYTYFLGQRFPTVLIFRIIGAYWFGFLQYSLMLLPISDLAVWLLDFTAINKTAAIFVVGFITVAAYIVIFILGSYNAYRPSISYYSLQIPKKTNRKTLKIAMASDMHFGGLSGKSHLKRLVRMMNEIEPDLVLMPGDIVDDDSVFYKKKNMSEEMKKLKAPIGVYGVIGNHEVYGYGRDISMFVEEMKQSNVVILMDEVLKIEDSFYLIGRKDKTVRRRNSFEELLENLDKSMPIIAMDHQPTDLQAAADGGVDLLVCGHTHRGQMAPNHLVTRRMYEVDWGYKQKGSMHTIVSSGFGFWGPPLRLGSQSEIVEIEVTFTS
ncbi:MAG: metallophosphoesterase [Bacillus sp. (in: firmicutes)]